MDKKMYNKPDIKVVLLRHRAFLLTGSDPDSDNPEQTGGGKLDNPARRISWDVE